MIEHGTRLYSTTNLALAIRSPQQVAELFTGYDLVPPGLVRPYAWRPDPTDTTRYETHGLAGIGKPNREPRL